jgi:hypothetical protein
MKTGKVSLCLCTDWHLYHGYEARHWVRGYLGGYKNTGAPLPGMLCLDTMKKWALACLGLFPLLVVYCHRPGGFPRKGGLAGMLPNILTEFGN